MDFAALAGLSLGAVNLGPDRRQPDEGRKYQAFGWELTLSPRGRYFHIRVAAFIGAAMVTAHEIVYRLAGGESYELHGVLSHAGTDMLLFTVVPIVFALVLIEHGRAR